jgi:hypothetical protein
VRQSRPTTKYGRSSRLTVDGSPVTDSLLAFDVDGVGTRSVTKATLRLFVSQGSVNGGVLRPTATGWSESTVTWRTAPAGIGTTPLARLDAVAAGTWVDVDVTSLVDRDGAYSVRISSPSGDAAAYHSREASSNRPRLVLETSATSSTLARAADARGTTKEAAKKRRQAKRRPSCARRSTRRARKCPRRRGSAARRVTQPRALR